MSSITPRLLNDTLNLITLARETALARGQENQAARLTTVVDGLRQATRAVATPAASTDTRKPAAVGALASSDFQALLAATQATPTGSSGASGAGERGLVAAAMAAGGMPEVDIARQLGITREEVRLMVASQGNGEVTMIKGLYAAASAMLANLARQNEITHNLANIDTPGFRQVLSSLEDFKNVDVLTMPARPLSERPTSLGQLGLGVESTEGQSDFTQGALEATDQPLDFAIMGDGFFRVNTPDGERYTRDGRFVRDAAGSLVTGDGFAVLDASGAPITLADGQLAAASDGTLTVDGQPAGQLGLAAFTDPTVDLARDPVSGNMFVAVNAPAGTDPGSVLQGHLEMANVDAAQAMTQMIAVGRAYEAAQRMVQANDDLLGKAIQSLGSW